MRLNNMKRLSEHTANLELVETIKNDLNLSSNFARLESIRVKRAKLLFNKRNKPKNKGIY